MRSTHAVQYVPSQEGTGAHARKHSFVGLRAVREAVGHEGLMGSEPGRGLSARACAGDAMYQMPLRVAHNYACRIIAVNLGNAGRNPVVIYPACGSSATAVQTLKGCDVADCCPGP